MLSDYLSTVDWSRAQFAMTAIYHWLFVPLTLGLSIICAIMETIYYRTGDPFWKRTAKFWMRLFGINFAIGVATGLILEFEFGTNWSNYSHFVGDIFGAPLAIEGILAFFLESTFVAVMFFGWNRVSRGFHLSATWLTAVGANLSALWILVANSWMQYPVGCTFNIDTVRNEMTSFWDVLLSPVAVNKFTHTVTSSFVLAALFVCAVCAWYLLRGREQKMARKSIAVASVFGLVFALITAFTGDRSGAIVARVQPMKLAALEALYDGEEGAALTAVGILRPEAERSNNEDAFYFKIAIPKMLSLMSFRDADAFVPGINDLLKGGYPLKDGTTALSAQEKIEKGKTAIGAFSAYRAAKAAGNDAEAQVAAKVLKENVAYFGYGYIKDVNELVPNVPLTFYMFRVMVMLGGYFILFFIVVLFLAYKKDLSRMPWMHWVAMLTIPLGYLAGQAGWVVAECGRQPWAIQDMLPTSAAISKLDVGSVQTTFFIFLVLFTVMLIAEVGIMLKAIRKGPETETHTPSHNS